MRRWRAVLVMALCGVVVALGVPEWSRSTEGPHRYTVVRVAVDRVDVYAPSVAEARRAVEAWDRAYPHHREARSLQQTGVFWDKEYYTTYVVAKDGQVPTRGDGVERE